MAGLNVSIAGLSGAYRTRLAAMGATTLFMPVVVFIGTQVQGTFDSIFFRHALRVALGTSAGTAVYVLSFRTGSLFLI